MLYVHTDHLGAPQKLTDDTGAVVWDAAFTPFVVEDSITGTAANDNRFPGQSYEAAVALHYNWWRQYDPAIGRYIQSDPIGLEGGLNTYLYADANPVNLIDPEGLTPLDVPPEIAFQLAENGGDFCKLDIDAILIAAVLPPGGAALRRFGRFAKPLLKRLFRGAARRGPRW